MYEWFKSHSIRIISARYIRLTYTLLCLAYLVAFAVQYIIQAVSLVKQ